MINKIIKFIKNALILSSFSFFIYLYRLYFEFEIINIQNISFLLLLLFIYYRLLHLIYEKIQKYKYHKYLLDDIRIKSNPYQNSGGISCHFYSKGTKIKIGNMILKSPMIYVTSSLDVGVGEYIPFLVFSEMNLRFSNKKTKIDSDSNVKNYVQLTQSEKREFLKWLSRNKKGPIKNLNLIALYIKGLEYRFLKEQKDKKIIFHEIDRLIKEYRGKNSYIDGLMISLLEKILKEDFILEEIEDRFELENFLFKNKIFPNSKDYHLLKWNYLSILNQKVDYETLITYYFYKDKKFFNYLNRELINILGQILEYYLEKDISKKYLRKKEINEVKHRNFIYNEIEYKLKHSDRLKKVLDKITLEISPFLADFNKRGFLESYSLLPIKYKKIIEHPYSENLNSLLRKREVVIDDIVDVVNEIKFKNEKLSISDSKMICRILNDNLYAVEPDAKYTNKYYKKGEYLAIYRNGNQILCKSPLFRNKQYLIDLIFSVIVIDGNKKEIETSILDFLEKEFKSINEEELERTKRKVKLNLGKRVIDLRSVMSYKYESKDIRKIISFLKQNRELLGVKNHRIEKIKETLLES